MAKKEQNLEPEKTYGLSPEHAESIIDHLDNDQITKAKAELNLLHAADIADLIDMASAEHRKQIIDVLRKDFDPEILVELAPDVRENVIELLGAEESAEAITNLETDDAVDVIEDLDEENQQEILDALPSKQRQELEEGLAYPEDSAGRLVDKKIVTIPEYWDVGQTIDFLRKSDNLPEDFYQIFIVNPKQEPKGSVMLSRMMQKSRATPMKKIMQTDIKVISTDMDQEEVAFIFRQYGLSSAPVVNKEKRIVGLINVDDVVDVIEEEAQEDIMRLGGISESDIHSAFSQTVAKRFPWLVVNLVTAIIASIVISFFEGTIQKFAMLAVLMPIVASMGGNAGTQTLTIAVRAIATKELTATNALRVVRKEIMVGALNGLVFAIIAGVMTFFWYGNLAISIIFAVATIVTLLLAGLAGALIPIGLVKSGVDPAIASGVFLTTVTDVVAFGAFLGLAATILP